MNKKMISKLFSLILVIIMIFSSVITANASAVGIPECEATNNPLLVPCEQYDDIIDTNNKSTSVPTQYYNLSQSNYNANLQVVGVSWLYTNYYFYCNSDNKLKVTYTIYSDTGRPTQMRVGLYDLESRSIVATWTSSGSTLDGITESFNFINLNSSHRYAVAFVAVFDGFSHDTVHGTATIRH